MSSSTNVDRLTIQALSEWAEKWGPAKDQHDWIKVDYDAFAKKFLAVVKKNLTKLSDLSMRFRPSGTSLFEMIWSPDCIFIYAGKISAHRCAPAGEELNAIVTRYVGFRPYIQYGREMFDPVRLRKLFYVDVNPNPSRWDTEEKQEKARQENEKAWKMVTQANLEKLRDEIKEWVADGWTMTDGSPLPLQVVEEITDGLFGGWIIKITPDSYYYLWSNDKSKIMLPKPRDSQNFAEKLMKLAPEYDLNPGYGDPLKMLIPHWIDTERTSSEERIGGPEEMREFVATIMEQPGGRRERARRATNPRFSPDPKTKQALCKELESEMYREELYELALELGLPVTKKTKKRELCKMLADYA